VITYQDTPIPVFSVRANWAAQISITEEWGVFARESLDTTETRRGSRPRPLYKLEYSTLTLSAQEQGYIRKVLEGAEDSPIAVGFWEDAILLSQDSVIGNPWIDVESTLGTLFDVLPYMMIWSDFNEFECHRVAAVNATQIQVTDSIEAVWPAGTFVVPVAVGKVGRVKTSALTDVNDVFRLKFEEVWLNEGPMLCQAIEGSAAGATLPFEKECIGGALL
jgi:hypothetical protein